MANLEEPPEISPGALYLLRTARGNDRHRAIARNAPLLLTLETGEELIQVCRRQNLSFLSSYLETQTPPQSFLMITAALLRHVHNRLDAYASAERRVPGLPVFTDFNRHVFQGFAQALADLAWPERAARDFDGPSPETFTLRISLHDRHTLWASTLQHYIANILQDYFAALRIREEVSELEPEVETELRSLDARLLTEHTMRLARLMGGGNAEPPIIILALEEAIDGVLEGESGE